MEDTKQFEVDFSLLLLLLQKIKIKKSDVWCFMQIENNEHISIKMLGSMIT